MKKSILDWHFSHCFWCSKESITLMPYVVADIKAAGPVPEL
jgi:hypothetical protein